LVGVGWICYNTIEVPNIFLKVPEFRHPSRLRGYSKKVTVIEKVVQYD
jgi:hypothetical protein